jgi:hypothetical protein
MPNRKVEVAPIAETELRVREVQLLINVIQPDPAYQPCLVTDEASPLDVASLPQEVVRERLEAYLKRPLPCDLRTPLWKLVDAIKREIPEWPERSHPDPN